MNFQLMAVAWGNWYVDKFLQVNLPSLLSPGNLPYLCQHGNGKFVIHTDDAGSDTITQSMVFKKLSSLVTTIVRVFPKERSQNGHVVHTNLWHESAAEAKAEGRWLLFVSADVFWGDGALRIVGDEFQNGKKVVYFAPLRVVDETFSPLIKQVFPQRGGTIEADPRALMDAALRHLAPMHSCYYYEGDHFALYHPEYLMFRTGSRQLVVRAVTFHCHAIDPSFFRLNDINSPRDLVDQDKHVTFITENFPCVSLTPILHQIEWLRLKHKLSFLEIAKCWSRFHSPIADYLWMHSFKFGGLEEGESSHDFAVRRTMALSYAACRIYQTWARLAGLANVSAARAIVGYLALHPRVLFRIDVPKHIVLAFPIDNESILAGIGSILKSPERLAAFVSDCLVEDEDVELALKGKLTKEVSFPAVKVVADLGRLEDSLYSIRVVLVENAALAHQTGAS